MKIIELYIKKMIIIKIELLTGFSLYSRKAGRGHPGPPPRQNPQKKEHLNRKHAQPAHPH